MVDGPIGGRAASRWWPPAVVAYPRLRLQLIANRQLADSLSRRREDCVAQGRRDRRHAGLAHAAHRLAVVAGDDVHANLPRRPGHPGHLVGVEVVLFHAAALEADTLQRRDADTHHARAPWAASGPTRPGAPPSRRHAAGGRCPRGTAPGIRRGSRYRPGSPGSPGGPDRSPPAENPSGLGRRPRPTRRRTTGPRTHEECSKPIGTSRCAY